MHENKQALAKEFRSLVEEFQSRVDKGVDYLDEHDPRWLEVIDADRLDLAVGCSCVLGQLAIDVDLLDEDEATDTAFSAYIQEASLPLEEARQMGFWLPTVRQCVRVVYLGEGRGYREEPVSSYDVLTEVWDVTIDRLRKERGI